MCEYIRLDPVISVDSVVGGREVRGRVKFVVAWGLSFEVSRTLPELCTY